MDVTRRKFLGRTAALGAGLALAELPALALWRTAHAAESGTVSGPHPAVLYDLTRCAGCHLCEVACQTNKGLPPETTVLSFRTADLERAPEAAWAVRRHQCMHCLSPACASACPVAAMQKTPEGPVIYRDERCLGCRYCMTACPFGVPQFDWERGLLDGALIRKCDFCAPRQKEGKLPACIEACPTGAVTFGERSEMLARAKELIAEHPDRYVDHIYGEHEAGGTSFLMISSVPFDKLGLPQPGDKALTKLPETIMGGVVPFAFAWTAMLTGVAGLVRLRERGTQRKEEKQ